MFFLLVCNRYGIPVKNFIILEFGKGEALHGGLIQLYQSAGFMFIIASFFHYVIACYGCFAFFITVWINEGTCTFSLISDQRTFRMFLPDTPFVSGCILKI